MMTIAFMKPLLQGGKGLLAHATGGALFSKFNTATDNAAAKPLTIPPSLDLFAKAEKGQGMGDLHGVNASLKNTEKPLERTGLTRVMPEALLFGSLWLGAGTLTKVTGLLAPPLIAAGIYLDLFAVGQVLDAFPKRKEAYVPPSQKPLQSLLDRGYVYPQVLHNETVLSHPEITEKAWQDDDLRLAQEALSTVNGLLKQVLETSVSKKNPAKLALSRRSLEAKFNAPEFLTAKPNWLDTILFPNKLWDYHARKGGEATLQDLLQLSKATLSTPSGDADYDKALLRGLSKLDALAKEKNIPLWHYTDRSATLDLKL
jgi:hypothetical protein